MNFTPATPGAVVPHTDEILVDVKYLQALLGLRSRSVIDDLEKSGDIPKSIRLGGSRRWRLGAVRARISQLEAKASADPLN